MAAARSNVLKYMAAGWATFTGSHLVMSHPPNRDALVKACGSEKNFLGLYSGIAAATFLPTTFLYLRYARGRGSIPGWTELTRSNPAVRALGLGAKTSAAITFGQGLATPGVNLHDTPKDGEALEVGEPQGIYRVTRHPLFTALSLLGLGNILLRGYAGDVVYWGGWVLIWAVGCPHQDYRMRVTGKLPKEYFDKTSFLPFAAILEGRNSLQEAFKEFSKPALATAIVAPIFFL